MLFHAIFSRPDADALCLVIIAQPNNPGSNHGARRYDSGSNVTIHRNTPGLGVPVHRNAFSYLYSGVYGYANSVHADVH